MSRSEGLKRYDIELEDVKAVRPAFYAQRTYAADVSLDTFLSAGVNADGQRTKAWSLRISAAPRSGLN